MPASAAQVVNPPRERRRNVSPMTSKLPELEDDGLVTPEVNAWSEEKYRLVGTYSTLFAKAMKGKWSSRVYIDLFSGAGRARIKGTNRIIPASPMMALEV